MVVQARGEKYAAQREQAELETIEWREEYHQELKDKNALYRKVEQTKRAAAEKEEERLQRYYVRLREQQLAAAAGKLASQGKNTAIRRQCKPIIPPPRKPPPVMYSTLNRSPRGGGPAASKPSASPPASPPHPPPHPPQGHASGGSRRQHSPRRHGAHHHPDKSTRRHGVYHPELEPLHMPDFATLRIDLFPNRMSDTLFLAEMSSSEQEKAELLNRAQHTDAEAAMVALKADAEERKRRATLRMMAARAVEIKQATKDTAEELQLQLRAEPAGGPAGMQKFPTIAT
jgi:hypothetical protein